MADTNPVTSVEPVGAETVVKTVAKTAEAEMQKAKELPDELKPEKSAQNNPPKIDPAALDKIRELEKAASVVEAANHNPEKAARDKATDPDKTLSTAAATLMVAASANPIGMLAQAAQAAKALMAADIDLHVVDSGTKMANFETTKATQGMGEVAVAPNSHGQQIG